MVSNFRATPAVFAVGPAATPSTAALPRSTRFVYTLSEQSSVRLVIQRALPRRTNGSRRYRKVGALSGAAASGAASARFTGKIGKRVLQPGRYRAVITATDSAGNHSAPRRARFRVAG